MTQTEIDTWKQRKRSATDRVAQAEANLKEAEKYREQTRLAFCKACDHRHPDGSNAMQGFAYAFCEICGECGG